MEKSIRKPLFISRNTWYWPQRKQAMFLIGALCAGIVASLLLFNANMTGMLIATMIGIGLDPLRAQFVTFLLMACIVAFVGTLVSRQRGIIIFVAVAAFCLVYLTGFVYLQLQPAHDPGGTLELLNGLALLHTVAMMIALAYLCAFVGAAVGYMLAEVLLSPLFQLGKRAWQHFDQSSHAHALPATSSDSAPRVVSLKGKGVRSWLEAGLMLVCLLLASGASGLFEFSPDVGLHTLPAQASRDGLPAHGTIVENQMVSAALGGQKKNFLVYLPPSYNTPQGSTRHYPTLYLLHGSPGRDSDWITGGNANETADTLMSSGRMPEMILVFPDGNGRGGETSEWGNSGDGRQLMETYVAVDLVHYVDHRYRTIPNPAFRGIGGNSMGGFGAMNIAVHHPDVFGFVISLGGYYRAEGSIWGTNPAYIKANSPLDVLPHDKAAWGLKMFIGAATHDEPYYADSKQFVQELNQLHIQYVFDVENGYHQWSVWQTQLYHAFLWLSGVLGKK